MKKAEELQHTAWRTGITDFGNGRLAVRGVPIETLMQWGSFGEVVYLLFTGHRPSPAEAALFNAIIISTCDHGPTSPSMLTARVIASGNRRAPEAAVGGGLLAIGDAHGGAGEASMVMLADTFKDVTSPDDMAKRAAGLVAQSKREKRRLPGLGHRFHTEDPRTRELWRQAETLGICGQEIAMMRALKRALEAEHGRKFPVNVDGAIAAILLGMGFEPLIGRLIFIIGRCAGVAAHVREELTREKPMRIRFPFAYDGPFTSPAAIDEAVK
ncbi:citryl-CoA lyase [Sodalis sp. RH22]|uniref:citryl-CoA lyase n=1 Tax=unclassified Sodalis (in: enterobacteria) TaxID=2636512 RepID=UPI0039B4D75B